MTENSSELRQCEDVHISLINPIRANNTTESSPLETTATIDADPLTPTVDEFSGTPPLTEVPLRISNRQITRNGNSPLVQRANIRTSFLEPTFLPQSAPVSHRGYSHNANPYKRATIDPAIASRELQTSANFDSSIQVERLHPTPGFSFASQQLFTRMPVVLPYESRIFSVVQRGDVDGLRKLLTAGKMPIDAIDPYGLGLFYVGIFNAVLVPSDSGLSMPLIIAGEAMGIRQPWACARPCEIWTPTCSCATRLES
jgi:hypothetical protein